MKSLRELSRKLNEKIYYYLKNLIVWTKEGEMKTVVVKFLKNIGFVNRKKIKINHMAGIILIH